MFIQIRVTPEFCKEPCLARWELIKPALFKYLTKDGAVVNSSAVCKERYNKFGEETHPHYHINLECDMYDFKKENFQKWFRGQPFLPSGNKAYSIKIVGDPEDENRWWRYLLKDDKSKLLDSNFPEGFDIELNRKMAIDERLQQIKKNIEARERLLRTDSFRLRAFAHLSALYNNDLKTNRQIFSDLVRYYQENNKIPPFNSLMNMVYDYKVHTKQMTPEDYYDQFHAK